MTRRGGAHLALLDGVILAGWLAAVSVAVLHERGQLWGGLGNPLASLDATLEAKEQWFGIYYQGHKIGFSTTMLVPEERNGVPGITLKDKGQLSFNLLGTPQRLEVSASAFIDADWRLQEFVAMLRSPTFHLRWMGRRHGDELLVTAVTPAGSVTKRLKDPSGGTFVNGLSSWTAFHRLRVGQSGKTWILNPLALSPEAVYFHVSRRESVDGKEALVVETDVSGITATSWVTPDGQVLKESSPLGWELRQESMETALRGLTPQHPSLDLLSTTAVPIDRAIEAPQRVERLVVLVEGLNPDDVTIERPWQRVLPADALIHYQHPAPQRSWCLLQLDRPTAPDGRGVSPPPELDRYRRPSLFVQSDDQRILDKARAIVADRTDPWAQAEALTRWVFSSVTKRLTVGLPSAVDVLLTMVGDCHEHTILFTALARSLGLPTRMVAGLVYWNGRLYYHAWPEVWHGAWIPVDPTLDQPVADATHLGLSAAENEQLIALGKFVGQLRVHVLEVVEETRWPTLITKHQIPISKHQTNSKHQVPSPKRFGMWDLVLGICLEFGIWNLVLGPFART